MAAKACIYLQDPPASKNVAIGAHLYVRMGMKNCGDVVGNFYGGIKKSGYSCVDAYNFNLIPGAVKQFFGNECDFYMPSTPVIINFFGGHAEGGIWKEDFSKTITITPLAVKGSLYVSSSPSGAAIYLDPGGYVGTTPKTISNLDCKLYKVTCKKSGYKDAFKWVTVKADETVRVHITLIPDIEECYHYFHVKDQYGANVSGANVNVSGVGTRLTGTDGKASFYLQKDKSYSITASKIGYSSDSKTIVVDCGTDYFILSKAEPAFHFSYLSKTKEAEPGQHVEAKIRIWNDSAFDIEVQAYIMDGATVIEKEPDLHWKNINVGAYTDITLSTYGPSPDMPDHDWHLDVKVCAREKGWF